MMQCKIFLLLTIVRGIRSFLLYETNNRCILIQQPSPLPSDWLQEWPKLGDPCRLHKETYSYALTAIPRDIDLNFETLDISRILGRIEMTVDPKSALNSKVSNANGYDDGSLLPNINEQQYDNGRITSVRIYDGFMNEKRCFLKEFLPVGLSFGKNELSIMRKLTNKWNKIQTDPEYSDLKRRSSVYNDPSPPFPVLLGHVISDDSIQTLAFR